MKSNHKMLCAGILLIIAVVMYFFNCFTPIFCDDWHYRFIFGTQTPIRSIGDIFVSQWRHYFEFNGRLPVHCIVQLFDGILGKTTFNIVNALFFALFLWVVALVTTRDKTQYCKVISVAFILCLLVFAGFKYVFLWLSGSVNYLWVATALLFFYLLMMKDHLPSRYNVPLLLYGFMCGWSNEAMVVGLGAAFFLFYIFHRKQLTTHRICLLVGFFVGSLFLVFAPAAIHRAMTINANHFSLMDRLVNMHNLRIFFLMVIFIAGKAIFGRLNFKHWVKKEQLLIIATAVSFAFVIFTGVEISHSRFGIELFSLLLLLRAIDWERINHTIVTVCGMGALVFAVYALTVSHKCYRVGEEELAPAAKGETLILTTNPIKDTSYLRRFVLNYCGYDLNGELDYQKYYGNDDWIPDYYGYHGQLVTMLPKAFIDDVNSHPELYNDYRTLEDLPFYAIRIESDRDSWYARLVYEPSKYDKLPWPLNRLVMKYKNIKNSDLSEVKVMEVKGERYALVRRPRPSEDYRLKEIQLHELNAADWQ